MLARLVFFAITVRSKIVGKERIGKNVIIFPSNVRVENTAGNMSGCHGSRPYYHVNGNVARWIFSSHVQYCINYFSKKFKLQNTNYFKVVLINICLISLLLYWQKTCTKYLFLNLGYVKRQSVFSWIWDQLGHFLFYYMIHICNNYTHLVLLAVLFEPCFKMIDHIDCSRV